MYLLKIKSLFRILVLGITSLLLSISSISYGAPVKAAFVLIGPANFVGWSYSHDQGRQFLEQKFGDQLETEYVEFVKEGRASRKVLQELANRNDIVFSTSIGYMVPTESISKDNPDVLFEHATGNRRGNNLTTYATRAYQPRYLSGLIAGSMTVTNKIGYVAAHPIPEVIRGINAFTLGVREANPNAVVEVEWTKSWYNPEKETLLAEKLAASGVDILTHHTDSSAVVELAEKKGIQVIGYHSDMSEFAPQQHLVSVVHNWGPYYEQRIQALIEGTWVAGDEWTGLAQNTSLLASMSNQLPAYVKRLVADKKAELIAGDTDVFSGPVKNHRGRVRIKPGRTLSDEKLLRMNWYVEGVRGSLLSF